MQAANPIDARIDVRQLARRARVPAAIAAVSVAAAAAIGGPARHLLDALERAFTADPRWVVVAAAFEALSFVGYIALLSHVAGRGNARFDLRQSYRTTLAGAAATRLLPTAGAGGAALTLWVLRRTGRHGRAGVRTLLTFLVPLYTVFLLGIFVSGIAGAHGDTLVLGLVTAIGSGIAMLVAVGLGIHGRTVFGEAMRSAFALARRPDPRLLGAVAWWGFDIAVLWACFHAFGSPPPWAVLVVAYFIGMLGNTLPLPGGIGGVDGGMIGALIAFGVDGGLAVVVVLVYRGFSFWLPTLPGALAYIQLRRTVSRWREEPLRVAAGGGVPGAHA
jgi:putative heme transporter